MLLRGCNPVIIISSSVPLSKRKRAFFHPHGPCSRYIAVVKRVFSGTVASLPLAMPGDSLKHTAGIITRTLGTEVCLFTTDPLCGNGGRFCSSFESGGKAPFVGRMCSGGG